MEDSVTPTIEKIKQQVQDNELKLKEKRELNATILTLNRNIHDNSMNLEKLTKEYESLIATTDYLQQELMVEKIRHTALSEQIIDCRKELDDLQKTSMCGISSAWEKRNNLFESVHNISDKCDIWALLIKRKLDTKLSVPPKQKCEQIARDDSKLKAAIDRRNKAISLRNMLLAEPDVGEEFVRTRNALQYSMEILGNEH